MPSVFALTGWLGGILLFTVTGALNIYTMTQNIDLAEAYPQAHSYSEIGYLVLGWKGKYLTNIAIWIMQLSCCVGYLYFIAEQMDLVLCADLDYCGH
jgi:amino acid permease